MPESREPSLHFLPCPSNPRPIAFALLLYAALAANQATALARTGPFIYSIQTTGTAIGGTRASADLRGPQADRSLQGNSKLLVTVSDETGVAVPDAQITLEKVGTGGEFKGLTNHAGQCEMRELSAGVYHLLVQKEGFYAVEVKDLGLGEAKSAEPAPDVEVILNHVQEFSELVDVAESPPGIDPAQTSASEK